MSKAKWRGYAGAYKTQKANAVSNPYPFTRPPTRIISWQAEVLAADPQWNQLKQRPIIYEFSNGRTFTQNPNVYNSLN